MQNIGMQQTADYLEAATIEATTNAGHAVIHVGTNAAGNRFALVNDCFGHTTLTEAA
ncbi:hypothetical protein [Denitromonas ohlonensis]|uniref:hypothetical protein n=1 Tax=Denitromonas ohlonensis TaxID=3078508 RepID=UPI001642A5DD|nr:hypothetical protein [Denitromonas ohlonensis]